MATPPTPSESEEMEVQESPRDRPHLRDEEDQKEKEEEEEVEYLRKFFVMPDFHRVMKGYVKEEGDAFAADEQVLTMESERFTVPEVLFRPTDIGMNQAGIVEGIGQAIQSLHEVRFTLLSPLHSPPSSSWKWVCV
jgi:hypothetical protein